MGSGFAILGQLQGPGVKWPSASNQRGDVPETQPSHGVPPPGPLHTPLSFPDAHVNWLLGALQPLFQCPSLREATLPERAPPAPHCSFSFIPRRSTPRPYASLFILGRLLLRASVSSGSGALQEGSCFRIGEQEMHKLFPRPLCHGSSFLGVPLGEKGRGRRG